jgi:AcrR family transcriptional regulator
VGISRRTFYRCFSGVDEIVEALVRDDFVEPVKRLRGLIPLDEIKSSTLLMLERNFNAVFEKKDLYTKLLDYHGRSSLAWTIVRATYPLNLEIFRSSPIFAPNETEFSSYFTAVSLAMIIDWWLREKINISPKQMAKFANTWVFSRWRAPDVAQPY